MALKSKSKDSSIPKKHSVIELYTQSLQFNSRFTVKYFAISDSTKKKIIFTPRSAEHPSPPGCLQAQLLPPALAQLLKSTQNTQSAQSSWFLTNNHSVLGRLHSERLISEAVYPLRHLRTRFLSLRNSHYLFLAPKVYFLHSYSHTLSHQMLRLLFPILQASPDQLCTYQSQTPNAHLPNKLNLK